MFFIQTFPNLNFHSEKFFLTLALSQKFSFTFLTLQLFSTFCELSWDIFTILHRDVHLWSKWIVFKSLLNLSIASNLPFCLIILPLRLSLFHFTSRELGKSFPSALLSFSLFPNFRNFPSSLHPFTFYREANFLWMKNKFSSSWKCRCVCVVPLAVIIAFMNAFLFFSFIALIFQG